MLAHRLRPCFERGVFRLPWSLERRQSMVDLGDVAEVAAAVLADRDRHATATYELVAPGRYTAHDLAEVIAGVIGRPIAVERISPETFLGELLGTDLSRFPYETRVLRAITDRYSSHDFVGNPNVLQWLLGRPATSFARFVQAHHAAYQGTATRPTSSDR